MVETVAALIPAYNCADRIAATVAAAQALPGVAQVLVVDDGSQDDTTGQAARAGARVIRHHRNRGKGAALRTGAAHLPDCRAVLLMDADLGESATALQPLLAPVLAGKAHMTIATVTRARGAGGFGLAVRSARLLIRLLTGQTMATPLSGQRCLSRALVDEIRFADRFAVEVALTLDALLLGATVVEVPTAFTHRVTGWSLGHVRHRARQLCDVWRAALPRLLYPFDARGRPAPTRRGVICALLLTAVMAGLILFTEHRSPAGDRLLPSVATAGPWVLLGLATLVAGWWLNRGLRLGRLNWQQREIPGAMGLGLLLFLVLLPALGSSALPPTALWLALGFGLLGLGDDLWGSRAHGGFKGHLGALRQGRVTTGLVKLVGGAALALAAGWALSESLLPALVDGTLIALAANFVNLLDLRPGRALKTWLLLAIGPALAGSTVRPLLAAVGVWALLYAPLDLGAKAMLGDTGANALGALAGLGLVLVLPFWGKVVLIAVLLGLHLLSEKHSFSAAIERFGPLRALDRLGRRDL